MYVCMYVRLREQELMGAVKAPLCCERVARARSTCRSLVHTRAKTESVKEGQVD